jgi:hypothetical protein
MDMAKNIHDGTKEQRRSVLKLGGASLAMLGGLPLTASANNGARRFEGIAYNPRTGEEYGNAFANLNRVSNGKVTGVIQLPDYAIPVNVNEPLSTDDDGTFITDNYYLKAKPKFKQENLDVDVKIPAKLMSTRGASVSGWIYNPRTKERDAFFLGYKEAGYTREKVRKGLKPIIGSSKES